MLVLPMLFPLRKKDAVNMYRPPLATATIRLLFKLRGTEGALPVPAPMSMVEQKLPDLLLVLKYTLSPGNGILMSLISFKLTGERNPISTPKGTEG
jgi:hypothetical protein